MHIAMLGSGWSPDTTGGLERYYSELRQAHLRGNHDVAAVVIGPVEDPRPGVHVAARANAPLMRRLAAYTAASARYGRAADVVDAHFALYGEPARRLVLRGQPLVTHFHGPWGAESAATDSSRVGAAVKRSIESAHHRRAARVIVLSRSFRDLVVDLGVEPDRVRVVKPGVDLARFAAPSIDSRLAQRRRWAVPEDRPVVVSVRRMVPRMGLDVLLSAWRTVSRRRDRPVLVLVGDGPIRLALQAQAEAWGIADSVLFPGRVSEADLPGWYGLADLSCTPSRALEGFGLVLLESMASGTPALASDVGGMAEALQGGPGALVPPGDEAALAAALDAQLDRDLTGDRIAARAHAERFTWDDTSRSVIAVYREALADHTSGGHPKTRQ